MSCESSSGNSTYSREWFYILVATMVAFNFNGAIVIYMLWDLTITAVVLTFAVLVNTLLGYCIFVVKRHGTP